MLVEEPTEVDVPAAPDEACIGAVTRSVAWIIDVVIINVVATLTGVGTALILSVFPVSKSTDHTGLKVVGAAVYALWCIAYFVVFWATTGQTPGARVMQIRLVSAARGRVQVMRALVRWVGMQVAIIALFTGYIPVLFRRRPLPDWMARTLVVDAPQTSLLRVRQESLRRRPPTP